VSDLVLTINSVKPPTPPTGTMSIYPKLGAFYTQDDTGYEQILNATVISQISIDVSGNADVTLTLAQAFNNLITLTGTLTGNINVILPAGFPSFWGLNNQTTGAFNLNAKIAGSLISVNLIQSTTTLVYSDATNIFLGDSSKVPISRLINGHSLATDLTLSKADIGLSNVVNLDTSTTSNITDSLNKRFVTDSNLVTIGNQSGVNTGDETNTSILAKLGAASATNNGYLASTDWTTFNNKQNAITTLPIANGGTNNTSYVNGGIVFFDGTKMTTDITDLFYDSASHRVGISTSVPSSKLDVHGTTPNIIQATSTAAQSPTGGAGIGVISDPGSAMQSGNRLGVIAFAGTRDAVGTLGVSSTIESFSAENWTGTAIGSNLSFSTTPIGTATPLPRMTILNNGNVGIGNTSPLNMLEVGDNAGLTLTGKAISVTSATSNSAVGVGQSSTARGRFTWAYNATPSNAYLIMGTGSSSNALVLQDAGGFVGIGTSTPSAALDVNGLISGYVDGGASTIALYGYNSAQISNSNLIGWKARGSKAIPTAVLAGDRLFNFGAGGHTGSVFAGSSALVEFYATENWTPTANGTSIIFTTTPNLSAYTARAQRMIIDQNGYIGIGTVTPTNKTEITGSGQLTAALADAGNRDNILFLSSTLGSAGCGGTLSFGSWQSTSVGALGFAAIKGLLTSGAGNTTGALAFSTRNATTDTALTERARFHGIGGLSIGSASRLGESLTLYLSNTTIVSGTTYLQRGDYITSVASTGSHVGMYISSTGNPGVGNTIANCTGLQSQATCSSGTVTTLIGHQIANSISGSVTGGYSYYCNPIFGATGSATTYYNYQSTQPTITAGASITTFAHFFATGTTPGLSGLHTLYGLNVGAMTISLDGTANAAAYGVNIGAISSTNAAASNNYGINIGAVTGATTANYGISIAASAGAAISNFGISIGAMSGAGTANYGIAINAVTGATNNYAIWTGGGSIRMLDSAARTAAFTGQYLGITSTSSTASIAKIGLDIQSIGTWNGAGATNTGLNVNVSGGTTNYAALFSGGSVGIGTTTPNSNAILDCTSTTQAFLPPRMTTAQKNAVASPVAGMIVYDSTLAKLCVYTGAAWQTITSA